MGLLDTLTGGSASDANRALSDAQKRFEKIQAPTAADLTLPELQQYVDMGIMTPAEAKAALQQSNAYNDINLDPSTMEAEQKALGELSDVATDKGMTPAMQAQLTEALNQTHTQENGANAAILDQMAQRGIPTSLMGTAAQMANSGRQADSANATATQAAGQAEQNAINAMMAEGNLAGSMHGQQYNEAQNKANAANAMQQWNAGATNSVAENNANRAQQATGYNVTNKQNVANENTGLANHRTEYNASVPETVFQTNMAKAGSQAGIDQSRANQSTQQGNQYMGLIGAGIGAAGNAAAPAPVYNFDEGGSVPGHAVTPGDSRRNDRVPAMLSPGEVVIPRSVAPHPEAVKRFVQHLAHGAPPKAPVHPDDVHSVLEALSRRRGA